jgi:pantetheine-phosphate adenylyltransferase
MNNIIYPGTFDPVTLGHSNLIERAAHLFDHVIVAVADSKKKSPLFNLDERVELIELATEHLTNVSVIPFTGLIVDVAQQQQCKAVLRGVRSMTDFDYELQMANMNSVMYKRFETVFLTPANHLSFISSTLVREIASMNGDVSSFVHPAVLEALNQKFAGNR